MKNQSKKLRTIVYVDGFNLYYGALRNTKHKWLDLTALFNKILNEENEIIKIKYFTARISSRDGDTDAPSRQNVYLKALEASSPLIEIYYGHYLTSFPKAKVHNPPRGTPPFVTIIKTEEKGSDVNIALHILNDAWKDACDCVVLVSNDSDLAEALRLAKEDHNKKIGLIIPGNNRHPSKVLMQHHHFFKMIRDSVLASSQLPDPIPGTCFHKPISW